MPVKSKAQFRAMQAAAHGKGKAGIPRSVGKEYLSHTTAYNKLPEKVKSKKRKK